MCNYRTEYLKDLILPYVNCVCVKTINYKNIYKMKYFIALQVFFTFF